MDNLVVDINLIQLAGGTSTNTQGYALYIVMKQHFLCNQKIRLSLKDATPMSSSFLNSSIGELIDEFGIDKVKSSLSIVHYTPTQAKILKDYINAYRLYNHQ